MTSNIKLIICIISLCLLLLMIILSSCCRADGFELMKVWPNYKNIIVFDAGSSGSRVISFMFEKDYGLTWYRLLKQSKIREVNKPLRLLRPLKQVLTINDRELKVLFDEIAERKHDRVNYEAPQVVFFAGGTAGLRAMSNSVNVAKTKVREVDVILNILALSLFKTEVVIQPVSNIRVLSGVEEAAFTWLAVNYLTDRLNSVKRQFGTIELGGGSVQIAYRVRKVKKQGYCNPENTYSFLFSETKTIEVHGESYLGFGVNQAYCQISDTVNSEGNKLTEVCKNFDGCLNAVERVFAQQGAPGSKHKKYHSSMPHEFYLNGYIYDRTVALGLPEHLTPSLIRGAAEYICNSDADIINALLEESAGNRDCVFSDFLQQVGLKETQHYYVVDKGRAKQVNAHRLCVDLTYISALLERLGLRWDHPLWVQKYLTVNDQQYGVSWPLGYAIAEANGLLKKYTAVSVEPPFCNSNSIAF